MATDGDGLLALLLVDLVLERAKEDALVALDGDLLGVGDGSLFPPPLGSAGRARSNSKSLTFRP